MNWKLPPVGYELASSLSFNDVMSTEDVKPAVRKRTDPVSPISTRCHL